MMISSAGVRPIVSSPTRPLATAQAAATEEVAADQVTLGGPQISAQSLGQTAERAAQQAAGAALPGAAGVATLKVLSFNVMMDCQAGVDNVVNVIKASGAQLVGLQESIRNTRVLAKKLDMHFIQQDKRTALLSKFPIESFTPGRYGVKVTLENGQKVAFLNAHLTSFPFQSHQLCHLPTGGGPYLDTEEEAIASAEETRGAEVKQMLKDADSLGLPAIATGDFNEPSHLDWTPAAAEARRHPIKVQWPASTHYEEAGFKDSYREIHPDEMAYAGNTWTPTKPPDDPKEHHDRIDFVHYRGDALKLKNVEILGEKPEFADVTFDPWPSDHRAVLATFEVAAPAE